MNVDDSSVGDDLRREAVRGGATLVPSAPRVDAAVDAAQHGSDDSEERNQVPESFVACYRRDLLADVTVGVDDPQLVRTVIDATNESLDENLQDAKSRFDRLSAANRLVRQLPAVVAAGRRSPARAGS